MRRGALMAMLAGVLFALPGVAKASPLPSVDLGVRELGTDKLTLISRRTDADWWVLITTLRPYFETWPQDTRIQVFRSSDAGRSWREDVEAEDSMVRAMAPRPGAHSLQYLARVEFLVWYSPEVGLMAGYIGESVGTAEVLRTVDGGRTWTRVKLPQSDGLWVYDLERAGRFTWLCGSSGNIYRSDDSGATWTELKGTPFNDDDRCIDMSFLDWRRGWAVGTKGSVWATEDGGTTWRRLETPASSPPQPPTHGETDRALHVTTLSGGKRVITVGTSDDGAPATNRIPHHEAKSVAVMGDDTAVRVSGNLLSVYVSGRHVRTSPLTTEGSGVSTPLDGFSPSQPEAWVGWKEDQIVMSLDQGLSWFVVGRVPEKPLRNVVVLKDGRLFAQTQMEKLFVSKDLGRTWARSTEWLDAYDFALANGAPPEGLASPLQCLLTAPEARVRVRFSSYSCYSSVHEAQLELSLSKSHAVLSGSANAFDYRFEVRSRKLPRDEGLQILRTLVKAAMRQETLSDSALTSYQTGIEWSCLPEEFWHRKLEFSAAGGWPLSLWRRSVEFRGDGGASSDRKHRLGGVSLSGLASAEDYTRALGVLDAALHALKGAHAE